MRILVVDNYDSFTYNLVQSVGALGASIEVYRNDAITVADALARAPDRIVISPGPGGPNEAGVSKALIHSAAGRVPVLGVCLGLQCLAEVFGGRVIRASPVHGKTSSITHDGQGLYRGVPSPTTVARYHSLVVDPDSVGADLEITSWMDDGTVAGLRHGIYPLEGVQFHPESFMTPDGERFIANFLTLGIET